VMLNLSRMQLDDKNKESAQQNGTNTNIISLNYTLGFLKSGTHISAGLNYTSLENNMYSGNMYSGSLGVAQQFFKNKLSANWTNSYMANQVGENNSNTLSSYLSATYRPHPKHAFNIGVNFIANKYANTEYSPSYNETRGEFRYAYSF